MNQSKPNAWQWWGKLSLPARLLLIGLTAPILVLNFWALSSISSYFGALFAVLIVASLLAFLLNYPVSWIEQHGGRRSQASIIVFLFAISVLFGLGVTLVPIAFTQAQQLTARLPEWIESGRQQAVELSLKAEEMGLPLDLDALSNQLLDRIKEQLQALTREVLNLAVDTVSSLLDVLINVVLTIVLTFYLLQHGDELWNNLTMWLPPKMQAPFSRTLRLSFQNYFIGQLILGTFMAAGLIPTFLLLKVPFGLLFGLTIGVMALVPFGGSAGIALVTLLVTLQDFWLGLRVLGAALLVQQVLENLIAPRIIGSMMGLNPVWVFLSILAGAKVGGLLGVVVAVPTAVVIKTALVAVRSRMHTPELSPEVNLLSAAPESLPAEDLSNVSQV
ncbi:MAG: AI-2E family transporter [Aphanocapsa sp. GSE-SYN-MK-11-07L]|nr:AI-2E family transporter [Aphanocapsa sp. GSE-SYN-MK-11-07L]